MAYYPAPVQGEPDNTGHTVAAWIITVLTAFYMLPWAIAASRHSKNAAAIALLTFFLGWTGAGWIGALVWACVDPHKNAHLQQVQPVVVAPVMMATPAVYQPVAALTPATAPAPRMYASADPYAIDPYADNIQDPYPARPARFPQYQPSGYGSHDAQQTTYVQQLPYDDPRALPPGN